MTSAPGKSGELRPARRVRLYEQLERQLRRYIRDAGLKPGDRFPTERELAEQLAVSRTSVRQAIVSLQVQGLVDVRHGDGMYVRRLDGLLEPPAELLERRRRLPEILEARDTLECRLAALAAERRTAEDLAAIYRGLDQMQEEIARGDLGTDGDAIFHHAVTMAAKNEVLVHLMSVIQEPITESRFESLSEPGRPRRSLAAHRRIADAIQLGDARAAAHAMHRHIKLVSDVALLRWRVDSD
ncbi:MAG: FadR/GntR family transcriptional regulator [Acidimicrobiales bacterium]